MDIVQRNDLSDMTQLVKRLADNPCSMAECKLCNHLGFCLQYEPFIDFDFREQFFNPIFMEAKRLKLAGVDMQEGVMRTRNNGLVFIDDNVQLIGDPVELNPYSFTIEVWFRPYVDTANDVIYEFSDTAGGSTNTVILGNLMGPDLGIPR